METATTENLYTEGKIRTYTGRYIDVFNPKPGDIDIEDIAHSLSMNVRWGGMAKADFKIAQHCVMGAHILLQKGLKLEALHFLLHDAEEAYLHDLPGPIKCNMPEYVAVGNRLRRFIYRQFGLPAVESPIVKEQDKELLEFEWEHIVLNYHKAKCTAWYQEGCKAEFLKMFNTLTQ